MNIGELQKDALSDLLSSDLIHHNSMGDTDGDISKYTQKLDAALSKPGTYDIDIEAEYSEISANNSATKPKTASSLFQTFTNNTKQTA